MSHNLVCSVIFGEAEPSLWYFIRAPVVCVVVGKMPRVHRSLDNGVIAGNILNTQTHAQLIDMLPSLTHFLPLPPLPHQKLDSPVCCNMSTHYHLVASLPLEEEQFGGSVWQAGLVVPHQVPTHKPTVVPRMQSGIQQEGVILRTDRHIDQKL